MIATSEPQAWRYGHLVVVSRSNPTLPHRCIISNQSGASSERVRRAYSFGDEGGNFLGIPMSYKLLHSLFRMKLFTIEFSLSTGIRIRSTVISILSLVVSASSLSVFMAGILSGQVPPPLQLVAPAAIVCILGIWSYARSYMILEIVGADESCIYLRGAGQRLLASLEQYQPGERTDLSKR